MPAANAVERVWGAPRPADAPKPSPQGRRWSFRIARIAGIDIYVHATLALLLAWVAFTHLSRGIHAMLGGLLLVCTLFAIIVMHELAHALAARRFGIGTRDILLLPIGGISSLERMPDKPAQELVVAIAGPLVNVVLALVLFVALELSGARASPEGLDVVGGPLMTKLLWINVSLAVFNLLPAFPMDGGRVVRAALALRMDHARATAIAARLGEAMALVFGVLGLLYNPMLLFIAIFVWMGAAQESSAAGMKKALSGVSIADAMATEFRVLSPDDRLSAAAPLIVAGFQHDFPVVEDGRLVGLLTRADVVRGLSGGQNTVEAVMHREFTTADADAPLESALGSSRSLTDAPIVVLRRGQLVGLLTAENVGQYLLLRGALADATGHELPSRRGL